jgi:hypothetical protein
LCRFIKESHQAFRNFLLKYSLPMGRYRALDVHEQAGPFTESRERLERIWRLGVNARPVILHGLEEAPIDLGSISPSSVDSREHANARTEKASISPPWSAALRKI